ncbi:aromatic amino acid aminotransferase [Annulohypoxylon maeteangense]|uniref:aromatic amino acid aminotransferase n=1 Tax=Annulohypoxylon maeteangense TaxID=1927788 RepID=UPI0020079729|nr:aromatic amino acid aminotransferase [Annulohypoxylon maeteangense]KAI0884487.1 aromatic amino acid aminotransferase [Annulohypoxylon maeteangense]
METSNENVADMAKPLAKDMSHHFSDVTKARAPSKMKQFYKYFQIPNIGQFAGGLPNAQLFPFDTLEAQTARPDRWTPSPNYPGADDLLSWQLADTSISDQATASHVVVPHDAPTSDPRKKIDLATALQYGQADGYLPLLSFIRQFARDVLHPNVPYEGGPEVISTCGSTDGMSKTLEVFTNIWVEGKNDIRERPGLVTEVFMYSNVLTQAQPRGVQVVPIEMDEEGMAPYGPGSLEDVLANWDHEKGKRPHLMYTVTMGHNPTSGVLSLERRKELYSICSKYDVIIVEDDPYWYLQYPSAEIEEAKAKNLPIPEPKAANTLANKSGYEYIDSLAPSFLNVDVDGRVVRLDTFSKTIAPGCRMGWITTTPAIAERLLRVSESGTQQPSGFAQVVIAEMIMGPQPEALAALAAKQTKKEQLNFSGWKMDGWVRWLAGLRGQYERRMNRMCRILEENAYQLKQSTPTRESDADWGVITKTRLYDFRWPRGGMFLWLHLRFETHPLWKAAGTRGGNVIDGVALSTALMAFLTRKPFLVLISPGLLYSATPEIREKRAWAYFRICFAAEAEDKIDACSLRFSEGVQKFWRVKNVKEIEAILDEINLASTRDEEEGLVDMGSWMGC